jgi:Required for nuclear transport of RNA pol II C-terminus 1
MTRIRKYPPLACVSIDSMLYDRYVFQTSINGLAALGDIYPDGVLTLTRYILLLLRHSTYIIPKLAKQFNNVKLREDTRLKLGEALLQVAARCGEVYVNQCSLFLLMLYRYYQNMVTILCIISSVQEETHKLVYAQVLCRC